MTAAKAFVGPKGLFLFKIGKKKNCAFPYSRFTNAFDVANF